LNWCKVAVRKQDKGGTEISVPPPLSFVLCRMSYVPQSLPERVCPDGIAEGFYLCGTLKRMWPTIIAMARIRLR